MNLVRAGMVVLALALVGPATAQAAEDLVRVHVEKGLLVVTGTSGHDAVYFECGTTATCIVHDFDGVEAGAGCTPSGHITADCNQLKDDDGSFGILAEGGPGNDELKHGYQSVGSDAFAALILGGEGDDFIGGSPGVDVIEGGPGDDILDGQRGDDLVVGGSLEPVAGEDAGSDVVTGGWGSDLLADGDSLAPGLAAAGPDVISGGSCQAHDMRCRGEDRTDGDFDIVDLSTRTVPLTVQLANVGAMQGAGGEGDTYRMLDGVLGGFAGDILDGTDGANLLDGGPGADLLAGLDGDDLLMGGSLDGEADESDVLHGGPGFDEIGYGARTSGVRIDLGAREGQGGEGEGDIADDRFEAASGGAGPDVLIGSELPDLIFGLDGDDHIDVRGGGADQVDCGEGANTVLLDDSDEVTSCDLPAPSPTPAPPGGDGGGATTPPPPPPSSPAPQMPILAELLGPAVSPRVRLGARGRAALPAHAVRCPGNRLVVPCRITVTARHRGREMGRWRAETAPGSRRGIRLSVRKRELKRLRRSRRAAQLVVIVTVENEAGRATRAVRVPVSLPRPRPYGRSVLIVRW